MFRSPVLDLSASTIVKPIEDAHFGRIYDQAPERYRYSLNPKSRCVYVTLGDQDDAQRSLREASIIVRFTMNFMCEKGPLVFSFGLHAEEKRKFTPIKFFDVPAGAERQDLASIPFRIKAGCTTETIRTYHSTVETAIAKNPAILITLNRMNWFLTKSEFDDSIIDLTIGLESLIPGKDELRYRFSLYLAFVTEPDPSKRLERFRLFRSLYDTRSRIVHGGDLDKVSEKNEKESAKIGKF